MSYIHEALRKAQRERDNRHQKYGDIVSAGGKRKKFFASRIFWWICIFIVLFLLAFSSYSLLASKAYRTNGEPEHEKKKPLYARQPEAVLETNRIYDKARLYHKSGHMQDAMRLYQETLRMDPGHSYAMNNLGVILMREKDFAKATISFEKAIRVKPGYVDAYYNLACVYAIKGEVEESLINLKKAAALDQSVKDWAQIDEDLRNLRGLSRFKDLMGNAGVE